MLRRTLLTTALAGAAFLGITQANAAAITWDLGTPVGFWGTPRTILRVRPRSRSGRQASSTAPSSYPGNETALFGKEAGGDEVGLGLNDDPTAEEGHEINGSNSIQLNITNAVAAGVHGLSFIMDSTTGCTALPCTTGDSWRVFGSNSATSLGAQLPGLIGFDEGVSHLTPVGV